MEEGKPKLASLVGESKLSGLDLITGIHGNDPVQVDRQLSEVMQEVIDHLQETGKLLPPARTKPMIERIQSYCSGN